MISPTKRRGRPASYVVHNGQPIIGLSRMPEYVRRRLPHGGVADKPDGRYYVTGSSPRTYLGTDFATALRRLESINARAGREYVAIEADATDIVPELAEPTEYVDILDGNRRFVRYDLPSAAAWAWFGAQLRSNPELVARKTGIPEIAFIDDLKPKNKLALTIAGQRYFDDKKADYREEREWRKSKAFWDEFVAVVAKFPDKPINNVEELSNEVFQFYANRIRHDESTPSDVTHKPRTKTYRRSRFIAVKSVLNYANDTQQITPETHARIRQAWKRPLKIPAQSTGTQVALTRDEFTAILRAATIPFDRGLVLMGINAALYPVDFSRLQWRHVNLNDKTLVLPREKKDADGREGTTRVAVLFDETVKALRKQQPKNANPGAYVFSLVADGSPIHKNTVNDHFKKLVTAAKIKRRLTYSNLRDSVATATSREVPSPVFRVIMGHKIGDEDRAYIESNPYYVADGCRAIYKAYFGK